MSKKEYCSVLGCFLSPSSNGKCWKHQNEKTIKQEEPEFKNQIELFNWIWDHRQHKSELSGRKLTAMKGSSIWRCYFLHVLPKGKYPQLKLSEEDILLGHDEEHRLIDQGTMKQREEYKQQYPEVNWDIFYNKQETLKQKYGK